MRKSAHSDRLWWRHVVFASVDRPFAERALALSEPENAQNVRFLPAPTPFQHCDVRGSIAPFPFQLKFQVEREGNHIQIKAAGREGQRSGAAG